MDHKDNNHGTRSVGHSKSFGKGKQMWRNTRQIWNSDFQGGKEEGEEHAGNYGSQFPLLIDKTTSKLKEQV